MSMHTLPSEEDPPRYQSLEMLSPELRYVASSEVMAFIHGQPPKPCGCFHKKKTTAIRCARKLKLGYVVTMVRWDRKKKGWLAWKNEETEQAWKSRLTT